MSLWPFFHNTRPGELSVFERHNLKLIKESRLGTVIMWSLLPEEMEARSVAEL